MSATQMVSLKELPHETRGPVAATDLEHAKKLAAEYGYADVWYWPTTKTAYFGNALAKPAQKEEAT